MSQPDSVDVTAMLKRWAAGDEGALERLVPQIQGELRRLAGAYLAREHAGHTLQPTALVNEAFLRLAGERVSWENRAHFFGIAATHMRRILTDHARRHLAAKRNGGARVDLDEAIPVEGWGSPEALLDFDRALDLLATTAPRAARVAELHYFGGLTVQETAAVIAVSPITVKRDLKEARALLAQHLGRG